jgi:hypothetical protein
MNLPDYFYLRKKKWTVVLTEDRKWYLNGSKGHKILPAGKINFCWGETDFAVRTITLWHDQAPRKLLETFIHEYLHAVEYEYDLKIPHKLVSTLEKPIAYLVLLLIKHQ